MIIVDLLTEENTRLLPVHRSNETLPNTEEVAT